MHASHIANLQSIIPNLDRAVFDGDVVAISGGDFDSDTLRSLLLAAKWAIARNADPSLLHDINDALSKSMDDKLETNTDGPWLPVGLCMRISQAVR